MGKTPTFEIIGGSYEEFLVGYNFSSKDGTLVQSFATHDHTSSVRCVTFCGHYLASGGADDRIFVYDLQTRKEHCSLTHHNSTVNCVAFTPNNSHLMSGSSDGVLSIVRVGNWQLEKLWDKGHKGSAILDVAIHLSGKLALTLGADSTLCTWNLVKGRQAYVINLRGKCKDPKSLEKILWNSDGVRFLMFGGKYTEVWSIESGGVLDQFEHQEKVTSCTWKDENIFIAGHEDGQISIINTEDKSRKLFKVHEQRVKSLVIYKKWLVSASSNGGIKVWNKKFEEVASVDSGCRITCVCVVPSLKEEKPEEPEVEAEVTNVEEVSKKRPQEATVSVTVEREKKKKKKKLK